jgi:hypothetical protein
MAAYDSIGQVQQRREAAEEIQRYDAEGDALSA